MGSESPVFAGRTSPLTRDLCNIREFTVRKRNSGEHRWKTTESTLSLIEQLARVMSDKQIAAQLNRMGIKSAKGYTWTRVRVGNFRKSNNILNYTRQLHNLPVRTSVRPAEHEILEP